LHKPGETSIDLLAIAAHKLSILDAAGPP